MIGLGFTKGLGGRLITTTGARCLALEVWRKMFLKLRGMPFVVLKTQTRNKKKKENSTLTGW